MVQYGMIRYEFGMVRNQHKITTFGFNRDRTEDRIVEMIIEVGVFRDS